MKGFIKRTFRFWQRHGLHILPVHFYSPVPDTGALPADLWQRTSDLPGIDMNPEGQIALARDFAARYRTEYDAFPAEDTGDPRRFYLANGNFLGVDAEILYCMVRDRKPRRIIEIGAGASTLLAAEAHLRNRAEGAPGCHMTAVEPYPNATIAAGLPGLDRLIRSPVQEVPLAEFAALDENDILFIDSSHVLKIGSDVAYEFLEILPRLAPGVLVHVHDIFLPLEYPKNWLDWQLRFWNEQYLLQAFLAFNDRFQVLWAGSYMHVHHPEILAAAFGSYRDHGGRSRYDNDQNWPLSFWMRRV